MKNASPLFLVLIFIISCAKAQKEPWSSAQLLPPKTLAKKIDHGKTDDMLILSIGFDDLIKESKDIGPAEDAENVKKLKAYLSGVPKDKDIVIYCGCCPLDKCPNVRPAFKALNDMGFTNAHLLNLKTSIKADWLDEDYPTKN